MEAILTTLDEHTILRKLDLSNNNTFEFVAPNLLARATNLLEEVNINNIPLSPNQVEALFGAIAGSTKLKILQIGYNKQNLELWLVNSVLSMTFLAENEEHILDQISKTMADVKKDSILEIESVFHLSRAFEVRNYQISIEADRFKMIEIN